MPDADAWYVTNGIKHKHCPLPSIRCWKWHRGIIIAPTFAISKQIQLKHSNKLNNSTPGSDLDEEIRENFGFRFAVTITAQLSRTNFSISISRKFYCSRWWWWRRPIFTLSTLIILLFRKQCGWAPWHFDPLFSPPSHQLITIGNAISSSGN